MNTPCGARFPTALLLLAAGLLSSGAAPTVDAPRARHTVPDFVAAESVSNVNGIYRTDRSLPSSDPSRYILFGIRDQHTLGGGILDGKNDLIVCEMRLSGEQGATDTELAALERHPYLEELYLTADITDAALAHLKGLARLRVLALASEITGSGLSYLKGASNLRALVLYDGAFTDAGLEPLNAWRQLEELQIVQRWTLPDARPGKVAPRVTDRGLERLSDVPNLRRLRLENIDLTDAGLKPIRGLTKLERLVLTGSKINGSGLANLETLTELRSLTLGVPTPASAIVRWKNLSKLEELSLFSTGLTDEGLSHLAAFKNLKKLTISNENQITGKKLADVLKRFPKLTHLDLSADDNVDDDAIKVLDELRDLRELCLDYTSITSEGLKSIEPLENLRRLELMHDEKIGDAGLKRLNGLKHLEELLLISINITSKGLTNLKDLTALRVIDLSNNEIDDDGLKALLPLRHLEEIGLDGTKVTEKGIDFLCDNLPALKLVTCGGVRTIRD